MKILLSIFALLICVYSWGLETECAIATKKAESSMTIQDADLAVKACANVQTSGARPFILRGTLHFRNQQCQKAIPFFRKALEREPGLPLAYMNLSACYQQLEQYDQAISEGLKGVESYNSKADAQKRNMKDWAARLHANLGLAYYSKSAVAENFSDRTAIKHFLASNKIDPNIGQNYFYLGMYDAYLDSKIDEGLAKFKKACSLGFQPGCEQHAKAAAFKQQAAPRKVSVNANEEVYYKQLVANYIKKGLPAAQAQQTVEGMKGSFQNLPSDARLAALKKMVEDTK